MQIECPKCHFRQPEDRFCARCGIDMQTYKPPEKSLFEKIWQNGTVIFFVGMLLLISSTFFYFKSTKLKNDSIEINKKSIFIATQKSLESSKSEPPALSATEGSSQQPVEKVSQHTNSKSLAELNSKVERPLEDPINIEDKADASNNKLTGPKTVSSLNLVIQYAEVNQKGYYLLEDEAKSSGQYVTGDYSQGVLNISVQKLKSMKTEIQIYSTEKKVVHLGKTESWFQGLKSSNDRNNIGLRTEFKVKEFSGDKLIADLKISKRFQANPLDPNSKTFQTTDFFGTLEISEDQIYFLSNVLNSQPLLAQQEYLTSISPFEILKSTNLKNGETFSVFFYHFEK